MIAGLPFQTKGKDEEGSLGETQKKYWKRIKKERGNSSLLRKKNFFGGGLRGVEEKNLKRRIRGPTGGES